MNTPQSPSWPIPYDPQKTRKFPCVRCNAQFERPSSLRQHLLTHTGEKPHPCHMCNKRFSVISNLRRHHKSCQSLKSPSRPSFRNSPSNPILSPQSDHHHLQLHPSTHLPPSLTHCTNSHSLSHIFHPTANNFSFHIQLTIPLPPAIHTPLSSSSRYEERDSYDDATPSFPYHPASWIGKLPGPALMEVDYLVRQVIPGHKR